MATLYVYKNFNNYYNRKLKKYNSLSDYGDYTFIETDTYCNFNPNDGIDTEHVLGRPGYNDYYGDCDYLIYSDDNINITSRWFIIEQKRTMGNQYRLTLHRDVIADNWDKILNSECFIEKAILTDSDYLIFNQEDITTNQIKTNQTLLKDKTGCPWIVIYYDKSKTISGSIVPKHNYDISVANANDWASSYTGTKYTPQDVLDTEFRCYFDERTDAGTFGSYLKLNYQTLPAMGRASTNSPLHTNYPNYVSCDFNYYRQNNVQQDMFNAFIGDNSNYKTNAQIDEFYNKYNGAILYQNSGSTGYYRVNILRNQTYSTEEVFAPLTSQVFSFINSQIHTRTNLNGNADQTSYSTYVKYYTITVTLTPLYNNETITYEVDSGCYDLIDAPYRMACMPYGNITEKFTGNSDVTSNKELNFEIANNLPTDEGSKIYDIQIVPYCPLNDEFIITDGINAGSDNLLAHAIKQGNNTIGYIYSCSQSSFSRHIDYSISINNYKIENQCDIYRLCSPNYNGVFEFNAAKNLGISGFDISCTYKPSGTPYIHISPDFQGLYGTDYNDNRGLICGGDFSLARVSNAWTEYQLQNKNFQNIFDRQIENMEVNHKYDMIQSTVGAGLGAISSGVGIGAITGNPIVGAAAGIASGMGGIADLAIKQKLYNENLDYTKDLFGYNLENIKAQPQALSRTTGYNIDNNYFPFLEYYTCSPREKEIVANKIAWNSMTVMAIGKISEYINNSWSYGDITDKGYIKARLIRLEGSNEDFHNVNVIADELNKGVYTK